MPHLTDFNLSESHIADLGSVDAIASFLHLLGYDTANRTVLTPESLGLADDAARAVRKVELLAEDPGFLQVIFIQPRSLTARLRNELVRHRRGRNVDQMFILTPDFDTLEFVLLVPERTEARRKGGTDLYNYVPRPITVDRRGATRTDLRTLRRFTWTCQDGVDQFAKLRTVFESARFTGEFFLNRGLFSDYFLRERLQQDPAWADNPPEHFAAVRELMQDATQRWGRRQSDGHRDEALLRTELFEPLFERLGFQPQEQRSAVSDEATPDYLLCDSSGNVQTAAFVYQWERWLDGPDTNDPHTPDENPGAYVVSALDAEVADWIIVTNGRYWRLYGRRAHARSTNYYEVDLLEALTDPNEAFRYWLLFFRPRAFEQITGEDGCWLDTVLQGSRDYAKRLGERLKDRVFFTIFPHLAQGFLQDRRERLGIESEPTREELDEIFEATLTLLYRLLFLLFAESRDLLPVNEAAYLAASLKTLKEEVGNAGGAAEADVHERLCAEYSDTETNLYNRLQRLSNVMADGDPSLNVPKYNGGLFNNDPQDLSRREDRIARFLLDHAVPDRHLALAIDRLARDQDERTLSLVFIDYKSLEVRHLGSIYEGLLEFRLKVATEDLTTKKTKGTEKYVSLTATGTRRKRQPAVVVHEGEVYLSNDKADRKASGSYYTPDPIVEYIVTHTVGPVLDEKLAALEGEFRRVRPTFNNELQKSEAYPVSRVREGEFTHRQEALQQTYNHHRDLVDRLFDLKVCDPAMGSGHFLVEVVDQVTDRLLTFLNRFPVNPVSHALERTREKIRESLGAQGVSVDADNLTDVNLLKRFVLKRCVYGVDLNPMAVELAKVSLWLDCFTLGAPLNFLDHHLRCGNSLIGATFDDLQTAVSGREDRGSLQGPKRQLQMLSLNYQPLLEAIRQVLEVSQLADATAADVATSSSLYESARQSLSAYRIFLDLLVARHFGFPNAPAIVEEGHDIEFDSRERFLASLRDDTERETVQQVEQLAHQRDRRFFHWELEFPEVFFGIVGAGGQQVRHKDRIEEGSAGFDCVVGNPPYDELSEHALGRPLPEKNFLKKSTRLRDALGGRLNVFRFFVLQSLLLLREGGAHSFIVPMAIMADTFTLPLRKRLLTDGVVRSVDAFPQKDDPHNRVFLEAKLSTCVYLLRRHSEPEHPIQIRTFPGKSLSDPHKSCAVTLQDLQVLEPRGLSLPAIDSSDLDRWRLVATHPSTTTMEQIAPCYLGEIMFNASNNDLISRSPDGPRIYRGGNVNRYQLLEDAKQGEVVYLDYDGFRDRYANDARITHHNRPRIAFQEAAPIDNWRRLIPAYMPADRICGHTLRYFSVDSRYDLYAVLACLASASCEWRFGLTSTNNHVNAYEIDALPVPRFARAPDQPVDWERWGPLAESGAIPWESAIVAEMHDSDGRGEAESWPYSIHDGLAAAGKQMSSLGEALNQQAEDFAAWLVEILQIDEERFTGMTYLRSGHAQPETLGEKKLWELIERNRRACGIAPTGIQKSVCRRYLDLADRLSHMRREFRELDAAIDRVMWQLLGLNPDGRVPETIT